MSLTDSCVQLLRSQNPLHSCPVMLIYPQKRINTFLNQFMSPPFYLEMISSSQVMLYQTSSNKAENLGSILVKYTFPMFPGGWVGLRPKHTQSSGLPTTTNTMCMHTLKGTQHLIPSSTPVFDNKQMYCCLSSPKGHSANPDRWVVTRQWGSVGNILRIGVLTYRDSEK